MRPCAKDCRCQVCTSCPSDFMEAMGPERARQIRMHMAHAIHRDWLRDRAALRAGRGQALEMREALAYVGN